MKEINKIIPIIPFTQEFYSARKEEGMDLDFRSIAFFVATGFFLGDTTYFLNKKCFQPGTINRMNESGNVLESTNHFKWHYSPRDISLKQSVEEFAHLFEIICEESLKDYQSVALPLSGGLDSRTLAVAVKDKPNVLGYSYAFENGLDETKYGKEIAEACKWQFKDFIVPKGYLWDSIEKLADVNDCYSDFTHPRQMAIFDDLKAMGDAYLLGHWGDVLFDDVDVDNTINEEEQVNILYKKVVKKSGEELARVLWSEWGLKGDFASELKLEMRRLLANIKIDHPTARIRAFKSMYWAPRWTSVNLSLFNYHRPIVLPYYDDRMCQFICEIPERHLKQRQIQIDYIKLKSPELAKIEWQSFRPCNLYNYKKFNTFQFLPYRVGAKLKREFKQRFVKQPLIERNWENQFLGTENEHQLKKWLFDNAALKEIVPASVVSGFYDRFKNENPLQYSHAVSMILTLSLFSKKVSK